MTDWNTPDGLKAFEIIGPVEWGENGRRYMLATAMHGAWMQREIGVADQWAYRELHRPVAACILNDAAWAWLLAHNCSIVADGDGPEPEYEITRYIEGGDPDYTHVATSKDKSSTLIAAVLAVHANNPRSADDN